ncbi:hypothetical protein DFJ43DRAFT_1228642 [Lentinula guzmanii]|uniref:DOT1 domain-containing protein n=1 Tax=Lentinula guzmanii TaxID=2804957 RepID=A0AA38J564_9AGAR|nr:hypothetical protein DFJ43DRAFT_1228642 [Lentinula guzmanii]
MNRLFAQTPRLSQQSRFSPILEGSYGRCIKPYLNLLPATGSHVYGEFMPLMLDFIQLDTNSIFLNLGSDIGTTVAQAAFACQCFSYGIEIWKPIAKLGDKMIHDVQVKGFGEYHLARWNWSLESKCYACARPIDQPSDRIDSRFILILRLDLSGQSSGRIDRRMPPDQ